MTRVIKYDTVLLTTYFSTFVFYFCPVLCEHIVFCYRKGDGPRPEYPRDVYRRTAQ